MYANSWLYHYYSVQSKIQFGIPYEGPARVQQSNNAYLQQQQQHHANNLHQHQNHHNHNNHHHHSPNSLQTSLTHSYLTPHHMPSYGYHSPVPQHQGSPGLVNYYSSTAPQLNYHASNEGYRPYAYRVEPVIQHAVDYSSQVNQTIEPRCTSLTPIISESNNNNSKKSNASQSSSNSETRSPPAKRRLINRLLTIPEPIYIPEHQQETSSNDETLNNDQIYQTAGGDGETVLLTTVLPARYAHAQTHIKAIANEPTDLIDQWNPSPPWSETTQKVPDIAQQELSPYLARTPPTPTSAPLTAPSSNSGAAFSFDWMPEQFVPIMDSSNHANHAIPVQMAHDGGTISVMPLSSTPWSSIPLSQMTADHKLYGLHYIDRSPEDEITKGKRL